MQITSAIPPVFAAYGTIVIPTEPEANRVQTEALLTHLKAHSPSTDWWLGYLDTGADDIVFPQAPMVTLYAGWRYVLVLAGPKEAATWRAGDGFYPRGPLPDLLFPTDRAWLLSRLWDDDWWCIGGTTDLLTELAADPDVQAREVSLTETATPPGHQSI